MRKLLHKKAKVYPFFSWRETFSDGGQKYHCFKYQWVGGYFVDLCGNYYCDYLPGNGLYVDLDGTTNNAGLMTTKTMFSFEPDYTYELSYDLAGSQRGDTNTVVVSLGSIYNQSFTLESSVPFQTTTHCFTVQGSTNAALSFDHDGWDCYGPFLDNVSITSSTSSPEPIPEPCTMLLLGTGLVGLAGIGRRRFRRNS